MHKSLGDVLRMTLNYIKVQVDILQIKGLSLAERIVLGLVASLPNGLRLGNDKLAEILNLTARHVSRIITKLEYKGYVEIKNRQSKYRIIYFRTDGKVESPLLPHGCPSKSVLLPHGCPSTSAPVSTITKELKRTTTKARNAKPLGDDNPKCNGQLFERFWGAYPKKVGKGAARKAFAKHKPNAELLQKMLESLAWQSQLPQWQEDNQRYVPNAAKWLNEERWEDEKPAQADDSDRLEQFTHPATEEEVAQLVAEGVL